MNSSIETLNRFGGQFLNFAWPMLWQSSLLIAFVFALDFLLARKIRASVRYALWLAIMVKLLLPPTLALPTGAVWWLFQTKPPVAPLVRNYTVTHDLTPQIDFLPATIPLPAPLPPKLNGAGGVLLASVTVSAGLLLWLGIRWWQVARMVRRASVSEEFSEALEQVRRLAGGCSRVRLKLIEDRMSPAVCGLLRPVILLPRTLAEKLSTAQLRAVLLHEIYHLRRKDVWVNCAQALLQIVYWWHPLLWIANARIRRVREEAVDDAVMLTLRDEADSYAPTLLEVAKLAFRRPLLSLGLVGIMESRSALRQRIERLVDFRAPRKAGLTFASLCGIFVFSAVALPMGEAPAPVERQPSLAEVISTSQVKNLITNQVPVLIQAEIYQVPAGDFKNLVAGLQFKPGARNENSWWSASPEKFSNLEAVLKKSNFNLLTKPRIQTYSGIPAQMYVGNGMNGIEFACTPVVKNGMVDLAVAGKVIDGEQKAISTNQFRASTALENSGGMVVRMENMDGLMTSNLVVVIGVQIVTNASSSRYQQRLQPIVHKEEPPTNVSVEAQSEASMLYSRHFRVSTNLFTAAWRNAAGMQTNSVSQMAASYFSSLGVDLHMPGKSIFYNDGMGELFVSATQADLDKVENAVERLNSDSVPIQVHIKARFVEVPKGTLQGFKTLFTVIPQPGQTNQSAGLTGILTDKNFRKMLFDLQNQAGAETLAEPEVVTTSGRQTQMRMQATYVVTIITNFVFEEFPTNHDRSIGTSTMTAKTGPIETSPMFDVVPYVLSDGYTLDLQMTASSMQFYGYANIPTNIPPLTVTTSTGETVGMPRIWPTVLRYQKSAHVNLFDNQTVILLLNNPEQVRFGEPDEKREAVVAKHIRDAAGHNGGRNDILVFITATIVDPAGNRVHSDGELPFAKDAIPSQPAAK